MRHLSDEKVLRHTFKKLGKYGLRLKVSNEHGSSYKYFTLFVKAAFDQGIFVLSADEEKKGRVSFMRPLSREEVEAGKEETFYTSAFKSVNPEYELNDPTDAKKIGPDMFISSGQDQLVYRIDAQTFDMYNVTDFKTELDWVRPVAICSKDRTITNYLVFSANGGIAKVDYTSDIAYDGNTFWENHPPMDKIYEKITGEPIPPSISVRRMRNYSFFLNYKESALYYVYDLQDYYAHRYEYPEDDLINVVMDKNTLSCLVARKKENPRQILITRGYASNKGGMQYPWEYSYEADEITLTRESIMQSNDAYNSVFYTNKNNLYRWYNWNAEPVLPETPVISLDASCEITCFSFTPDSKKIYLGVYDSRLTGLKGSVYVYDADELDPSTNQLKLLKKYEGVADRPIKVFWKNNRK